MRTWYCVTTTFDDHGRVTAGITATREAENQPESTEKSTSTKDIYCDWFGTLEEAEAFVQEAKEA